LSPHVDQSCATARTPEMHSRNKAARDRASNRANPRARSDNSPTARSKSSRDEHRALATPALMLGWPILHANAEARRPPRESAWQLHQRASVIVRFRTAFDQGHGMAESPPRARGHRSRSRRSGSFGPQHLLCSEMWTIRCAVQRRMLVITSVGSATERGFGANNSRSGSVQAAGVGDMTSGHALGVRFPGFGECAY
jgi:hypothetical protein